MEFKYKILLNSILQEEVEWKSKNFSYKKNISKIITWISKYSADIQTLICSPNCTKKYNSSEVCTLFRAIIAIIILLLSWWITIKCHYETTTIIAKYFLATLALWFTIGTFIYPVKVVFVDIPKDNIPKDDCIKSPIRSIFLLFINYIEIVIHFASFYLLSPSIHFSNCSHNHIVTSPLDSLYFSIVTITTLGYGDIALISPLGRLITSIEVLLGLVLIVCVLATFLNFTPKTQK